MFMFNDSAPISFDDTLPESVDVVIIGGGVIGICAAWYLIEQGKSVLVCDKGRVAGEQSSRNWGWVRTTGRDAAEVPIAMESTELWESLANQLGEGIGFKREGLMALAETPGEMAEFEAWMDIAKQNQFDTRLLSGAEADALIGATGGRWHGGMLSPTDGRAEPFTAVPTIARGVQARGGLIKEQCAVRTIEQQAGRVSAVVTEHGHVSTQAVICAAGGWSNMFLSNMGISLPQLVVRGTVARTESVDSFYDGEAALKDVHIRRREDGGYTVATGFAEHFIGANSFRYLMKFIPSMGSASDMTVRPFRDVTQQPFPRKTWTGADISPFESNRVNNPAASGQALRKMRKKLQQRIPQLADVAFAESWAGMIDAMPDVVPVMDEISSCPGLFLATGFSGHGFGIGPGAGKVMANLVTGNETGYDLSRFRFSRFSDGSKMVPGPAI